LRCRTFLTLGRRRSLPASGVRGPCTMLAPGPVLRGPAPPATVLAEAPLIGRSRSACGADASGGGRGRRLIEAAVGARGALNLSTSGRPQILALHVQETFPGVQLLVCLFSLRGTVLEILQQALYCLPRTHTELPLARWRQRGPCALRLFYTLGRTRP